MITIGEMETALRQRGLLKEEESRGGIPGVPGGIKEDAEAVHGQSGCRPEPESPGMSGETNTAPGSCTDEVGCRPASGRNRAQTERRGRREEPMQSICREGAVQDLCREESMQDLCREMPMQGLCPEEPVRWLTCDSRLAVPGTVFICKGAAFREEYLQQAADRGSIAYISERGIATRQNLPGLLVSDVRRAMAAASALFFGYTPGQPRLTGITGTKGKTTTAWYLKAMLDVWEREQGMPETGLISTVTNYDGKRRQDAVMTTPESPVIHELLANARQSGLRYMTMEVSSQALKYRRVRELQFDVGIFLNISEDHISPQEHRDFEDYFSAKLSMFRQVHTACVNRDADHAQRILSAARKAERVVTFGRHPDADIRYSDVRMEGEHITFRVTCRAFSERFALAMRGSFNIENAVAAIAAASVYGVPVNCMRQALSQTRVPGRMEAFFSSDGRICGIVDFAHNRLSFEKLFDAAYQEYSQYRRIITIFGCPGGKALNRRRELGVIAGLFSDCVCVTSDDPGTECQDQIAGEVRSYVEMTGCPCGCITERAEAVRAMVGYAANQRGKSLILLLGRGSEKYQRFGDGLREYPTDAALMREALKEYDAREN